MQMPDVPVNVPIDDPNADTEWNDILRQHGIIPEKPPSPTPMIEEALQQARELAHTNRLESKTLSELDDLEDLEDESFLESYRQKRLAELSTISQASTYNQVFHLQKPDYATDVTEASSKAFVCVLLISSHGTNDESRVATEVWRVLAGKWGDVKFCEMRADLCIEGYPDRNTPTILVYKDGEIRKQLVTLREVGGVKMRSEHVEGMLVELGAVKGDDARLRNRRDGEDAQAENGRVRQGRRTGGDDDDSDWD